MRECELAWAAGLFDGEGSVHLLSQNRLPRAGAVLTLEMTDQLTVERFAQIVGYGRLLGSRIVAHRQTLPLWRWRAHRLLDVMAVGRILLPYLVTKHEAVQKALNACALAPSVIRHPGRVA